MEPENSSLPIRPGFVRAFLPFLITASLSVVIFCLQYHVRHAPLTVLDMKVTVGGATDP